MKEKPDRQVILDSLAPLFKRARKEKLLFSNKYQGIIFTPDELEGNQKVGRFIWGIENWELINPIDYIQDLEMEIESKKLELSEFRERLADQGYEI
jgi:hypothetical protein